MIGRYRIRSRGRGLRREWCVYDFGGFYIGWTRSFEDAHALVDAHIRALKGKR